MSNKAVGMLPLVLFYCFVVNVDAAACPDAVLISPCVCKLTGDQVDMTCAGLLSLQSLSDIFGRTFPTTDMHSIIISGSKLGPLPSDVFKGKSFEMIQFTDNQLTSFDNPSIFSSSKTRLTSLILNQDADDWTFNFANVQGFDLLTSMQITGYNLLLSGTLSSTSLTQLFIQSDLITTLPSFGSLPNLSLLDLDGNTIETLPTNSFTGVNSLTEVYLGHNKLVSLPTGTLTLTSPAVLIVDLSSNLIDSFSTGWITGNYKIKKGSSIEIHQSSFELLYFRINFVNIIAAIKQLHYAIGSFSFRRHFQGTATKWPFTD